MLIFCLRLLAKRSEMNRLITSLCDPVHRVGSIAFFSRREHTKDIDFVWCFNTTL